LISKVAIFWAIIVWFAAFTPPYVYQYSNTLGIGQVHGLELLKIAKLINRVGRAIFAYSLTSRREKVFAFSFRAVDSFAQNAVSSPIRHKLLAERYRLRIGTWDAVGRTGVR
jgi:hypothetical protein